MYEDLIKRLRNVSMYFGQLDHVSVLLLEAADAIEVLSKTEKTTRWIPATERLPEYDSVVLVTDGEGVGTGYRYTLGVIGFTGWAVPFADIEEDDVSHWMPIPEPPKEGE
jgi:hypothetical protein